MPKRTTEERFWPKVIKGDGCWEWGAFVDSAGYGRFRDGEKTHYPHRYMWELLHGAIPGGMQIDHTCYNRSCVKPEHLRMVTQKQNMENISGAHKRSKTGIRGVSLDKQRNMYWAMVYSNNERVYRKRFRTIEEAAEAVRLKRLELFTHNEVDKIESVTR